MIPPLQAIRRVLWGNVSLNGKLVPVIKRRFPYDKTPCITIDDSGGSEWINRDIITEKKCLDNTHPQYDSKHPFKKYPQQVLREYHQTTIPINIWSDTVDEQEALNNIVMDLFRKAQSDHYMFCDNYHDGTCAFMDNTCYAKHFLKDKRGVKKQCPNPLVYGYKNIFTKYNLYRNSFMVEEPFNLDDKTKDGIIYRSVARLHTGYWTDHVIGGKTLLNVEYKDNTSIL